jgi:MFS transporter, YNFM family, putative membrane transport protein
MTDHSILADGAAEAIAHPTMVPRVAIGVISFLTLVDLFAAQAILPSLAAAYQVSPASMGFAVNASTMGMAAAGIVVALAGHRIDRQPASSQASCCSRSRLRSWRCSPV